MSVNIAEIFELLFNKNNNVAGIVKTKRRN